MKTMILAAAVAVVAAGPALAQQARDQIRAVGSSTVFPFTTTVAENYARTSGRKAPIVESTGTGGGFRLFCAGVGTQHPDISNASRPITKSEIEACAKNGVTSITEVKIGFDGIVLAVKKGSTRFDLTRQQVWLALARQVPRNGQLVANPHQRWSDIDPSLPNIAIEVMGPPPTSGTRDAFVEMVMDFGCKDFAEIKAIADARARAQACAAIREDGKFIEAGENDNLIVQRLVAGQGVAIGIFGFSFLEENLDKLQAKHVDAVEPTFENISSGKYPVSRSMFVYVKNAHAGVIPGLREFVSEYVSDRSMGENGYLEKKGLIPLPKAEREKVRGNAS
ncbi:MAG: substrate-binding domain-containing protein, partial [Alphaproteobacteria bacterium]